MCFCAVQFRASALRQLFISRSSTWPAHVLLTDFFLESPSLPFFLISSLYSHKLCFHVVFRKHEHSPVVSLLVPSSLMHSCLLCNTRSEHVSFTFTWYASIYHHAFDFPLSVYPSCNPHCNETNNLVDFALGKYHKQLRYNQSTNHTCIFVGLDWCVNVCVKVCPLQKKWATMFNSTLYFP